MRPKKYHLAFESYSGHAYPGTQPYEKPGNTGQATHVFDGIEILLEREDVTAFAFDFMALRQLAATLDDNNLRKFKVLNCLVKVFRLIDAMPTEFPESHWRPLLAEARKIMRPLLESKNGPTTPWFAINGHSHIDTAWLWPLEETERKCARTFSSILNLMEQYPEFRFIQSSPAQTVMVEKLYPSILKGMKKRVAEGRWEPNGAMWVEPDLNVPSGESLARQLLMGQSATRRLFNYTADVLWMPDVFGFSAALPQLCKLANVDFFCTHKLAWNDTNRFPHDTFTWKGIDGSKVIVHFNIFHCWPDPQTLIAAWNGVIHKDIQDRRLMDYGFGDGGGGPQNEMIEIARRTTDLEGCPRTKDMSISEFLQGVRTDLKDIPEWAGELYLECHRGTLTSISEIKRLNRKTEYALRDAELACTLGALKGAKYKYPAELLDAIWKRHLTNQFHDILPGSSIAKVNDAAIQTFKDCIAEATELAQSALAAVAKTPRSGKYLNVLNTLSWDRANEVVLSDFPAGLMPADEAVTAQRVIDVERKRVARGAGDILTFTRHHFHPSCQTRAG